MAVLATLAWELSISIACFRYLSIFAPAFSSADTLLAKSRFCSSNFTQVLSRRSSRAFCVMPVVFAIRACNLLMAFFCAAILPSAWSSSSASCLLLVEVVAETGGDDVCSSAASKVDTFGPVPINSIAVIINARTRLDFMLVIPRLLYSRKLAYQIAAMFYCHRTCG